MDESRGSDRALDDYGLVARSGLKRLTEHTDAALRDALARLCECGLAAREGDALVLRSPQPDRWDAATAGQLDTLRTAWLRVDDTDDTVDPDEVLHGDLGYWTHWWNVLSDGAARDGTAMRMDLVVADDGRFAARDWLGDFDPAVVDHVISNRLLTGRVIVPPGAHDTLAGDVVRVATALGVPVRVRATSPGFVIYDGAAAVLHEGIGAEGPERYRLTRKPAVVEALRRLFELQWAAAHPWGEYAKGSADVLGLLAEGLTDEEIASTLNLSVRTVSRRVSEAMRAADVRTRFQLGVQLARSTPTGTDGGASERPG